MRTAMRAPTIRIDARTRQKLWAALFSAAIHGALLAVILFATRYEMRDVTTSPAMQMVLVPPTDALRNELAAPQPADPAITLPDVETQLSASASGLPEMTSETIAPLPAAADLTEPASVPEETETPVERQAAVEPAPAEPATIEIPAAERASLAQHLTRNAQQASATAETKVAWEHDGKQYTALLTREPARDGTSLERVVAEVTSSDKGKHMRTRLSMRRLAFSQFTQVVDRWDPFVQLHDDKIVGRFHTNTRFNMTYDSKTAPQFTGKVTTAARSYSSESRGRKRDADIFQGGLETRADRIDLPNELLPFESPPENEEARIHKLDTDTRITFFPDGSYTWREPGSPSTAYLNDPSPNPVYFIAARGATVYLQGTVTGKILVYSPERIVIEGHLKYARDPRTVRDSPDYLGLLSDKFVEVAGPQVTGRGDLIIEAAIFAKRRFLVTNIDHPRTATLIIYGSLTAGSLSATEPRYATRIDYDPRFERVRPPGFPATNRYEVEDWNALWTEEDDDAELAAE